MDVLRAVAGIEVFPVISLVLFVAVFSGMLIWVARADRASLDRAAAMPLDESAVSDRRAGH